MTSFFDLVGSLQASIDDLDSIISGGENVTVNINGVQKGSISKQITDQLSVLNTGQRSGVIALRTHAELIAFPPSVEQQTASFKVSSDTDNTKNGYYTWVSANTYQKDTELVSGVLDPANSSDAISGKAVGDFMVLPTSYAIKRDAALPASLIVGDHVFYQADVGVNTFNGVTDSAGSAISITLQSACVIRFTKNVKGFTYEKVSEYTQGTEKKLIENFGGSAINCRDASFRMLNKTPFETANGAISIEVEFTFDHADGGTASLIGYGGLLAPNGVSVGVLSDYNRFFIGIGSAADNLFYHYGLVQGKKYHFIYTIDATTAKLFVDGLLVDEKAITPYSVVASAQFNIGGYYNYADPINLFRSPIKLVRYYNKALTNAEVTTAYNDGAVLSHIEDAANILELSASHCDGRAWVDTSGQENHPYLAIPAATPALNRVDVEQDKSSASAEGVSAIKVSGTNLFELANVQHDTIIDGASGLVAPWVAQDTISGVVKLVISESPAWYKVHGIDRNFGGYSMLAAGYNSADARLGLLALSEENHNTFNTFHVNGAVGIVYVLIYRSPSNSTDVPDLSNIYIERLDDEADYQGSERSMASNTNEISLDKTSLYNIANSKELVTISRLFKNKRLLVLGDSITANNQWLGIMTKKLGLTKVINAAIGGGNVFGSEDLANVNNDNNRHLTPQLKYTPFKHATAIRSYGEVDGGNTVFKPDNIIISLGFNDANNGWGVGDWATIKTLDWRTMPLDSVQSYLRYNIEKMLNDVISYTIPFNSSNTEIKAVSLDCRQAKIIYQTPIHTGGDDALATRLEDVRNAIEQVCKEYSVPIINARDNSGISRFVEVNAGGKYLLDTIHPNSEGYKKLAECNTSAFVSLAI